MRKLGKWKRYLAWTVLLTGAVVLPRAFGILQETRVIKTDYPRGPWWRADISQVVLAPAHILITYQGTEDSLPTWKPALRHSARSYEAALQLALRLQQQLLTEPTSFGKLARHYSDDRTSASFDGKLGVVNLAQLPEPMVDALGNLERGAISRVVHSKLGLHIITHDRVPKDQLLAGREICVGYSGLSGSSTRGSQRSRAQAQVLAAKLKQQLDGDQHSFETLLAKHSDCWSRHANGELGTQRLHDAHDPGLLLALSSLKVSAGSRLLEDGEHGFRLVQRMPADSQRYAFRGFMIAYESDFRKQHWPEQPVRHTRAQARVEAEQLLARLRTTPQAFEQTAREHCDFNVCNYEPEQLLSGTSPIDGLGPWLAKVPRGALLEQVFEHPLGFVVAQRVEGFSRTASPMATDVPRPPELTLETASTKQLLDYLLLLEQKTLERLSLSDAESELVSRIADELFLALRECPPNRRQLEFDQAKQRLRQVLGIQRLRQLQELHLELLSHHQGQLAPTLEG